MSERIRFVEAEYIDSGTFVAGEEDLFDLHYEDPEKGKRHELVLVRRVDVDALNTRPTPPDLREAALEEARKGIGTFFHHWKHGGISRDNQFHQQTAYQLGIAARMITAALQPQKQK